MVKSVSVKGFSILLALALLWQQGQVCSSVAAKPRARLCYLTSLLRGGSELPPLFLFLTLVIARVVAPYGNYHKFPSLLAKGVAFSARHDNI